MDKSTKDEYKSKEIEWHFVSAMRWDGPDGDQRETLNHFTCRQPVEINILYFLLFKNMQMSNEWDDSPLKIFLEIIEPGTQQSAALLEGENEIQIVSPFASFREL
jgi:hypothetical protein